MIFKWAIKFYPGINVKMSKEILNTHIKNNPQDYRNIYNFIMDGQLDYTIEDIKKIPQDFIDFMLKKFLNTTPSKKNKNNSESDSEEETNFALYEKEIFCINLLHGLELSEKQVLTVLKFLTENSHPKLMYWPSGKVKKFEGNLLPKITEYYKTNPPSFLVKQRRNVGILIDNNSYNFYELDTYLDTNNGFINAKEFCIEFPYMCYVYINTIDFTYEPDKFESRPFKPNGYTGSEIIVNNFKSCGEKNKEPNTNPDNYLPYQIIMSDNLETAEPCPYVRIHFNTILPKTITNLKIYGQAICLV